MRGVTSRCGAWGTDALRANQWREAVKLTRTYGTCPQCGVAFFPLDKELGLLSGGLTPRGEEVLARLSTWMPFESARELTSGGDGCAGE